ncbi:MAG: hypothetical protein P1U81_12265 [Verrucomicrobiales bacterium]|nr:hypothetical protein [Verrucomicrobiales bacterium]
MKKFTSILAIVAAFLSTDLQWSVMQTVTWVNMIQQSDSTTSLAQKVVSTITGQKLPANIVRRSPANRIPSGTRFFLFSVNARCWPLSGDPLFASLTGATNSLFLSQASAGEI